MLTKVFTAEFLRRLEAMAIRGLKEFRSARKGDRLANISGTSIEFADYRDYQLGDDLHIPKLTVLSIAPLLAKAIQEVFVDGSVTSLFDGVE